MCYMVFIEIIINFILFLGFMTIMTDSNMHPVTYWTQLSFRIHRFYRLSFINVVWQNTWAENHIWNLTSYMLSFPFNFIVMEQSRASKVAGDSKLPKFHQGRAWLIWYFALNFWNKDISTLDSSLELDSHVPMLYKHDVCKAPNKWSEQM